MRFEKFLEEFVKEVPHEELIVYSSHLPLIESSVRADILPLGVSAAKSLVAFLTKNGKEKETDSFSSQEFVAGAYISRKREVEVSKGEE